MTNWFHRFFNPHCEHCHDEYLDSRVCDSCNTLRVENAQLRKHNESLIQSLLDIVKPKEEIKQEIKIEDLQPVNKNLSWRARRQILETEDRVVAEIRRKKNAELNVQPVSASVEKLEEELGVDDAIRSGDAQV
jgi:hypothetical protein